MVFRSDITTDRAFTFLVSSDQGLSTTDEPKVTAPMVPKAKCLRTSLEMPLGLCRPEHWSRAQQFCPFFSVDWQGTLKPGGSWCPFILHLLCHFISSDGSFELLSTFRGLSLEIRPNVQEPGQQLPHLSFLPQLRKLNQSHFLIFRVRCLKLE